LTGSDAPPAPERSTGTRWRSLGLVLRRVRTREWQREHAPALVLGVGVVAQLALSIWLTRGGWFFLDAWHYILRRGPVPEADLGLFEPWGGHWQTIPILLYRLLFSVFGMHTYAPYVLVATLLHLVIVVLSYLILRRLDTHRWVAVVIAWAILFYGAGGEVFVWDGPIPLTAALSLTLTAVHLSLRKDFERPALVVGALLLLAAVMCSVAGVVGAVLFGVLVYTRRGFVTMVAVVGPAAVAFTTWYLVQGRHDGRVAIGGWDYARLPEFVWTGLTGSMGAIFGIPEWGGAILIALIVTALVARGVPDALQQYAWAAILAAFTQMTLAGFAALSFGVDASLVSRYKYISFVLLAPSIAIALTVVANAVRANQGQGRRAVPWVIAGALLLAYTGNGLLRERYEANYVDSASSVPEAWALGTKAAVEAGEQILTHTPTGPFNGDIDIRLLATPVILDSLPDGTATGKDRLEAEAQFFVGVGADDYGLASPVQLVSRSFSQPLVGGSGCSTHTANTFTPEITFETGKGTEIAVTSASNRIVTFLSRDGEESEPREWPVEADKPVYIAVSAQDAELTVEFDLGGDYLICKQ